MKQPWGVGGVSSTLQTPTPIPTKPPLNLPSHRVTNFELNNPVWVYQHPPTELTVNIRNWGYCCLGLRWRLLLFLI